MNTTDDAGQDAQHPAFGATGHHAGRGRFGIKAAITRSAQVRREDAGLAFETKDRAVNIGLTEQHAGVVSQVARRKIVRPVHDDVVRLDDIEGVLAGEPCVVEDDLDAGIDAVDGFLGRLRLGPAHIGVGVKNLALEIGIIDAVEVNDTELADASRGEVHGDRRAESTRPNAKHAGGTDFLLTGQTDFGKDQVPRVTSDFIIAQLHKSI